MNRKSFIKQTAIIAAAVWVTPKNLWAIEPKNTLFCIWGEGVHIADFQKYLSYFLPQTQKNISSNFDQIYQGDLHQHGQTESSFLPESCEINVFKSDSPQRLLLQNFKAIRLTGCDAGHYSQHLYYEALEKYVACTELLYKEMKSDPRFSNYRLCIATELGRDTHGGEQEANTGIACSHHCTEEARRIGEVVVW